MSRRLNVMWIDAFTDKPLSGNPCLVVLNGDGLSAEEMQTIAREINLSETAFVLTSDKARFRARYFTPAEEIPLAGHPTLAVTRALLDSGRLTAQDTSFTLQLEAGVITVELDHSGPKTLIVMTQKKPKFLRIYKPEEVSPVFGIPVEDFVPGVPIQTVSTGTPQIMMAVRSLEALRNMRASVALYNQLRANGDFFSSHVFCVKGVSPDGTTFARHLATPPDQLEDPFTGSATGGMGAYLWRYGLIDSPRFVAEQGHWMGRPGRGIVEVVGPREDIETVKVGGYAVTIMTGEMTL